MENQQLLASWLSIRLPNGSIKIDGVELKEISKHWIRSHIGIILQDPFLYATTIYENIKIGLKDIDPERFMKQPKWQQFIMIL